MEKKEYLPVHIRRMITRDLPEVLDIEFESFEYPWLEEDFVRCLKQRNSISMVAEKAGKISENEQCREEYDRVLGFMIYELNKHRIALLNLAVHPDYRRRSVGTQMVNKLISKLPSERRRRITLEVRETNLSAQLFFRNCGFKAINIFHDFYEDTLEDAYVMNYNYKPQLNPKLEHLTIE